jgi:hypothetical protein
VLDFAWELYLETGKQTRKRHEVNDTQHGTGGF